MTDDRITDPADLLAPLTFNSGLLPPAARFEAWRAALSNFALSRRETDGFAARATVWLLESLVFTHAEVDPLRYDRDDAHVRRDLNDHFALVYLLVGSFRGDFGHGEVASGPGSLTVLDMRRACWTDAGRLEAFILSLPRAFLIEQLGDIDAHGMVAQGALAVMLGEVLRGIHATLPTLERAHAPVAARTIRDLVAETLLDAHRRRTPHRTRDDALISRVRAHIDANLAKPLDLQSICTSVGASRSTLYRAFGGGGGVLQQVQRRRLHALRAHLADAAELRSIAELATALGFADKSHAARLFKREYGCTPGEYRARGVDGGRSPVGVEDVPAVFDRWTGLLD